MAVITRRRLLQAGGGLLAAVATAGRAVGKQRTIEVICRQAWGARKPAGGFRHHRIRRLTVHHSAVKLTDNRDAPARFRSHQQSHQANGWPDIAYHLLIDRHGNVYEGRPIRAVGDTATNYDPAGHLLVLCEGNFDEQRPSAPQIGSLVDVLAWAAARYDAGVRSIRGHLDYADTSCPGGGLYRRLGDVRRQVRARLAAGGVGLVELCGAEGRERVEDVEAGRA